jgi:hypothetical protein
MASIAAVLISVFGAVDGGIRSLARCILGWPYRFCGVLVDAACCLGLCVTRDFAYGALELTGEILRQTLPKMKSQRANRQGQSTFLRASPSANVTWLEALPIPLSLLDCADCDRVS